MHVGTRLFAHEKWFVEEPEAFDPDWSFFLNPATLAVIGAAIAGCLLWRVAARRLPAPELDVLAPLGRLTPWIPRLLGIHLGVTLLALAVGNAYLAPHLSLDPVPGGSLIALAEGFIGVWMISGIWLRPGAWAVVFLGPLGLLLAGPVAVLEAADLLGIALFLAIAPPGPDRFGAATPDRPTLQWAILVLKLGVGSALVVLSISEKLANPALAIELLDRFPALDVFRLVGVDLRDQTFVRFAGGIELFLGLLIISGAAPQLTVLAAGIPFNATLFFFGRIELIGHLPIYGTLLALLAYGSSSEIADLVPRLFPGSRAEVESGKRAAREATSGPPAGPGRTHSE